MERDLRVAAVSMPCPGGDPERVLEALSNTIHELSHQGVEVACFPEATLTGYSVRPDEAKAWAITKDSPWIQHVKGLASASGMTLLVGFMERGQDEALFLTHGVFYPHRREFLYRKIHLSPQEMKAFSPGSSFAAFPLDGTKGGIALCFESHFPEYILSLALRGAEILFFPSASPGETPQDKLQRWLRFMPARAYDNGAYVLACNQAGRNGKGLTFPAVALILDPKGRPLCSEGGGERAIALALLEARELNRIKAHPLANFLIHRRPDIYGYFHPAQPPDPRE